MFKASTKSGKVILVTGANKQQERESPLMGDLDPQVKTLLEQFQAKAVQHSAPAAPRSAMEKVVGSRQRVSASAALGLALEAVSKAEDFDIPGPAGRIPVRLYVPHTEDSLPPTVPTLVYYHGGGRRGLSRREEIPSDLFRLTPWGRYASYRSIISACETR
jgi:acetyl esterase/lipase